ncbi:YihY/virulence factor BrkB family protein [Litoribacter ruber]|uniref:YihY/virulence factor BrkB family protein n=1 Tax=Litoribacter ruber TaxID=702568 RepID=A0AAP2CE29_9BACT|nr:MULTISPECIES: YihY/virulence factor BrkB family protein [Litoribacter]MBS9522483.1 YihY/virulence factor BrkB family protein [Litoribacter alkaliphilus]MBT0811003.1 YihY/virulence factor BrkB family protein [Litoribacter ruber]
MPNKTKAVAIDTWQILKKAVKYLQDDEPIVYCAAIAFFTIFSLPAILIVILLVGILFFDEDTIKNEILNQADEFIGREAADQVEEVLMNVMETPSGFWYILIGVLVVIKSATMIFFIIQKALNSIWRVTLKKNVNYLRFMKYRSVTLLIVIGLGLVLVLSLMMDTVISVLGSELNNIIPGDSHHTITAINLLFNFLVILLFFTTIHKALPDAEIPWQDAFAGGIITSILFMIGKQVINLILAEIEVADYYAAAGSLVIILLWIFYSSIILFLGGEITKAYTNHRGVEVNPKPIAVKYEKNVRYGDDEEAEDEN